MSGRDSLNLKYLKTTSRAGARAGVNHRPKNFFCAGHQIGDISRPHAAQPSATSRRTLGGPWPAHPTVGTPRLAAMNHRFVRPVNPGYRDMAAFYLLPGATGRLHDPVLSGVEPPGVDPYISHSISSSGSCANRLLKNHLPARSPPRRGAWANPHIKKDLGGG